MKGLFPQFAPRDSIDYKTIWDRATFVFDANVLLNLYRYQPDTRQAILDTLKKLKSRIWIPYQAAIEFQRNRLSVILPSKSRDSKTYERPSRTHSRP